jgi:hypothetical protein
MAVLGSRNLRGRAAVLPLCAVGLVIFLAGCGQAARESVGPLPAAPKSVVTADFNGDGTEDALFGYGTEYLGVTEAPQSLFGFFSNDELGTLVTGSELLAVTDVDGDGAPDVIAAARGQEFVTILDNDGSGSFTATIKDVAPGSPPGDTHIEAIASATAADGKHLVAVSFSTEDPDAAVKPDNVVVYEAASGSLTPTALFQLFEPAPLPGGVVKLADVNGDGRLDLLLGGSNGDVEIYPSLPGVDGIFQSAPIVLTPPEAAGAVSAIAVGDVYSPASSASLGPLGGWTADGNPDIVAGLESPAVYGWQGEGGLSFGPGTEVGGYSGEGTATWGSLFVDPGGSGGWGGYLNGSTSGAGFIETPALGYRESFAEGCGPDASAIFANPEPFSQVPIALAIACGSASERRGSLVVPERSRLGVPTSMAYGDQRAGTSSAAAQAQLEAVDYFRGTEGDIESRPEGQVSISGASLSGPDAADFHLTTSEDHCSLGVEDLCDLKVAFSPRTPGPKEASLVVRSSAYAAPGAPPRVIPLSGTGTGAFLETVSALALGDVPLGTPRTAELTLTNTGNESLSVGALELADADPGWSAEASSCAASVAPGASCALRVSFSSPAIGDSGASLEIHSGAVNSVVAVPLSARGVASGVTAAPLSLGSLRVGRPFETEVDVTDDGNQPLVVSTVGSEGPDAARVTVDGSDCTGAAISPGGSCEVHLTVTPGARGPLEASLEIASNAPSSPNQVALSATGIQGVLLAPAAVDFGPVRAGFLGERELVLRNEGDAPLTFGTLAVAAPVEIEADGCSSHTLEPDGSCAVTLGFAPVDAGSLSAELIVPDDGEGGTAEVALSGQGLPPLEDGDGGSPAGPGGTGETSDPGGRADSDGPGGKAGPTAPAGNEGAAGTAGAALVVTLPAAASVAPGGNIRINVEVHNTGGSAAAGTTLRVQVARSLRVSGLHRIPVDTPTATVAPHASGPPPTRTIAPRTARLDFGSIAPGATREAVLALHALPGARVGAAAFRISVTGAGIPTARAAAALRIR